MAKQKGAKLSLVTTSGINPGDYPLYNLVGLSAGKIQCLVDALTERNTLLAKEILAVIPTVKLFL